MGSDRLGLMDLGRGDQFAPVSRGGERKDAAIVDYDVESEPVSVFESGAILYYLAEKTGQFMDFSRLGESRQEWLFWQTGNLGPMGGRYHSHFVNYAPPGGITRSSATRR